MNGKRLAAVVAGVASLGLMSVTAVAQDFTTPSHAEVDTSFPGDLEAHAALAAEQLRKEDAERYPFLWWRDTTVQNALWGHSATQFPNSVVQAYAGEEAGVTVRVLVYASQVGSNVVAIVGPTGNTVVGAGGSRPAARAAVAAFESAVPGFQANLRAIVLPDASPDTNWGAAELIGDVDRPWPVDVYAHAQNLMVSARNQAVRAGRTQRDLYTMGPQLTYGPDGNLGVGSLYRFNPYQPNNGFEIPDELISTDTTVTIGGVQLRLILTGTDDAGLAVLLPGAKVLVGGPLHGRYFPPFGAITGLDVGPVTKWISSLDRFMRMSPNVVVPMHNLPVTNPDEAQWAMGDQKAALLSIHQQTVDDINRMMTLDAIVADVKLPEPLSSSPWVRPFASTVEGAVREIYHFYMGWFDGKVSSLSSLSQTQEATFLVELAGGPEKALQTAKELERDHTLAGVQKAIVVLEALRLVAPSADADLVYVQALRKMAYAQPAGQIRNYYLLAAMRAEDAM